MLNSSKLMEIVVKYVSNHWTVSKSVRKPSLAKRVQ